jgi:antibiotic biosynthesis monooxygenase (ABM) superfamily enzyme
MPSARRATPAGVPRYQTVVITWLAIYPVLTLILALFGDQLREMVLPLRTLVITAVLVPSAVYVLVPLLRRILARLGHRSTLGEQ